MMLITSIIMTGLMNTDQWNCKGFHMAWLITGAIPILTLQA